MSSQNEQQSQPFDVINHNPEDVRAQYLEGVPYGTSGHYPGPFKGITPQQMNQYMSQQQNAQEMYPHLSTMPIHLFMNLPPNQSGQNAMDCQQYGPTVTMYPPIEMIHNNKEDDDDNNDENKENFNYLQNRGVEDFKDTKLTDPSSETGFGEIMPKIKYQDCNLPSFDDNPLLNIKNRPVSQFSHNNMVPFLKKSTQNMFSTGVPQSFDKFDSMSSKQLNDCGQLLNTNGYASETPQKQKLDLYTGCPEMYMHKREVGPMFSPAEQQTSWVHGQPLFRPDLNRYEQSLKYRNHESPVEKQYVGPGLAIDYSQPAQGGFQQYTRVMPNNVNAYRRNQHEGRVKSGAWFTQHPTSQFTEGLQTHRPKTYIPQSRRPMMRTKFYTDSPSSTTSGLTEYYTSVNRGKQARPDTEQGAGFGQLSMKKTKLGELPSLQKNPKQEYCVTFGEAPVGKTMKSVVPSPTQYFDTFTTIRERFRRNAAGWNKKSGYWECPSKDQSQGDERFDLIGITTGPIPHFLGAHAGTYVNLTNRGDINPYIINLTGMAQGQRGLWSPNSSQESPRVTTKETTQFSYLGNINTLSKSGQTQLTNDTPPVTRKETTQFSYLGNLGNKGLIQTKIMDQQPTDVTRKETTSYSNFGNIGPTNTSFANRFMYEGK